MIAIRIQQQSFDITHETQALVGSHHDIGAIITFTGRCRDENGTLAALILEHYPGMAEAEIKRIAEQAAKRWPLFGITIIHRYGKIAVGEDIMLIIATSAHRQAAFEAASFLMDFLKTQAPFWKKELYMDGSTGNWIEARKSDDEAAAHWQHNDNM